MITFKFIIITDGNIFFSFVYVSAISKYYVFLLYKNAFLKGWCWKMNFFDNIKKLFLFLIIIVFLLERLFNYFWIESYKLLEIL